jgi:hypothetical protein
MLDGGFRVQLACFNNTTYCTLRAPADYSSSSATCQAALVALCGENMASEDSHNATSTGQPALAAWSRCVKLENMAPEDKPSSSRLLGRLKAMVHSSQMILREYYTSERLSYDSPNIFTDHMSQV